MGNKIFVRSGNATIEASPELTNLVETLLSKALPETKKQMTRSLNRVYDNAKKNWLIRAKRSKGSINQLQKGIMIEGDDLVGFIRNNAQYAWAIKIGEKSNTSAGRSSLQEGKRLSNEVLWKPIKRSADEVAESLADDLMRIL